MERPCAKERRKICRQDGTTTVCGKKEERKTKKKAEGLPKERQGKNATKSDVQDRAFWRRRTHTGNPTLVGIKPKEQ